MSLSSLSNLKNLNILSLEELHNLANSSLFVSDLTIFLAVYLGYILIIFTVIYLLVHTDKLVPIKSRQSIAHLYHRLEEISVIFLAAGITWIVVELIKYLVAAPRPFLAVPDLHALFLYGGYDSFPSGHAAIFAALAMSLYFYHRRVGRYFALGAILIALARVAAGIHFPSDILAGFILGAGISFLVYSFLIWLSKHSQERFDKFLIKRLQQLRK